MLLYIPKNDMNILIDFLDKHLKENYDSEIEEISLTLKKAFKEKDFTEVDLSFNGLSNLLSYYEDNYDKNENKDSRPTYYRLLNTWGENAFK